jgi:hypothetical protein
MPQRSKAQQAKVQNATQACETYKQATGKTQKVMVEEVEDKDVMRYHPDICSHKTSPQEDPKIVEIINEFVHIQEDSFLGYDPELDDNEDNLDPLIEIQELVAVRESVKM